MVECRTKEQAVAHVSRSMFGTQTLTTKEAVAWAAKGVTLEEPEAKPE